MTGDCHVRFCESLGVRFPRATHLTEVSFKKFLLEIEDVVDVALDSVHLYRFNGAIRDSRTAVGRPRPRELGEPWIV